MDTTVVEAGASRQAAAATEQRLMKLHSQTKRHAVSHVSTQLGQLRQRPTASVALDLGWVSHVETLADGLAAHHAIVVAVILHMSLLLGAILLPNHRQNAVRSKSVLASRQAPLENMGFHPGDQFAHIYIDKHCTLWWW